MLRARFALGVLPLLFAARAQAQLPANGQRISNNDYTIDLAQTPVLSSTRVTGLAGAYVAIGEGTDGSAQNPAGVAFRDPYSVAHFDYDVALGLTFSSALARSDVFNSGRRTVLSRRGEESLAFLNVAGNMQLGRRGFGVSVDLQDYSLERAQTRSDAEQERLRAQFVVFHTMGGYGFQDGQLLLGLGVRLALLQVVSEQRLSGNEQTLFDTAGVGLEGGVLYKPNGARFRLGASLRTQVTSRASDANQTRVLFSDDPLDELYLPDRVTLPWEVHAGAAVQLGPRPFNPRWIDPREELSPTKRELKHNERERAKRRAQAVADTSGTPAERAARLEALDAELASEQLLDDLRLARLQRELNELLLRRYYDMRRFHLLMTASLDVLGPVSQAVGVESFLERKVQRSGTEASFSPRFALETEAIPNWMRVRGGFYVEPTRFADNPHGSRWHWTFGMDQRLLPWEVFGLSPSPSIWRLRGFVDVSRQYFSWGLALGIWH